MMRVTSDMPDNIAIDWLKCQKANLAEHRGLPRLAVNASPLTFDLMPDDDAGFRRHSSRVDPAPRNGMACKARFESRKTRGLIELCKMREFAGARQGSRCPSFSAKLTL